MRPCWPKQLSTASVKFCVYCRKYFQLSVHKYNSGFIWLVSILKDLSHIFILVQLLPTSQHMDVFTIEESIVLSVEYATCFKISTISAIVFTNIRCFIFKISFQTLLDTTFSNINFTLNKWKHDYESLCCIFVCLKCVWNALAVTQVIRFPLRVFTHGAWKYGILHWGYSSIQVEGRLWGRVYYHIFRAFTRLVQSRFNSSDSRIG